RRRGPEPRSVLQPHPGFGDHPQDSLGADEEAIWSDARAVAGQPAGLESAARRDHSERLDELVDVGEERREVAARAGRDPATERGHLEGLREVAKRQTVRPELVLERRPEDAALDAGGARFGVDLEHAVEVTEVHGDSAG